MSANGSAIAGTLTSGIQDIAALLPLLGTEQCENHISSALTKGYLYAAATPMSIFGSIGMARAGFKTLITSFSVPRFNIAGAQTLANMGFQPLGTNLSLIMVNDSNKDQRYLVETRLDDLLKELHIDTMGIKVSYNCTGWNITLIFFTAFFSLLGIVPYIYVNVGAGNNLSHPIRWTFPILRALGGFLTVTMMQLAIQRRITTITEKRLFERHTASQHDIEKGSGVTKVSGNPTTPDNDGKAATDSNSLLTWFFLLLLLLGICASVVGYIGCFTVVQNAVSPKGPLIWLGLEASLSIIRIILWGLNPHSDDAPPLLLILSLDDHAPLSTCMKSDDDIKEEKVLPLTRAAHFLKSITSFVGLIERFDSPDLTLYYTLTRKRAPNTNSQDSGQPQRILYITVFDHKERTTRIYMRDAHGGHFYATESDVPAIDLEHGLLEAKLGKEIHPDDDPVISDLDTQSLLTKHYQSIMDEICFTICEKPKELYVIENRWTMQIDDTMSVRQRNRECKMDGARGENWESTDEELVNQSSSFGLDCQYLELGRLEKFRRSLDAPFRDWIEHYMRWVILETRRIIKNEKLEKLEFERVESEIERRTSARNDGSEEREVIENVETDLVEILFIDERFHMEKLLVYEVERWEFQLQDKMKNLLDTLGRDKVLEKKRLEKEWRANCWKRLNTDICAMEARMNMAKMGLDARTKGETTRRWELIHNNIREVWQSFMEQAIGTSGSLLSPEPDCLSDLCDQTTQILAQSSLTEALKQQMREQCCRRREEMTSRLKSELDHIKLRLQRGLDCYNQFWSSPKVIECRYSQSKWLRINKSDSALLKVYSHELKSNNHILWIGFSECKEDLKGVVEMFSKTPSLTSIYFYGVQHHKFTFKIPNNKLLFINDLSHHGSNPMRMMNFLNNSYNQSQQEQTSTYNTLIFMDTVAATIHGSELHLGAAAKIAIRFFGPESGALILKLIHRSVHVSGPDPRLKVQTLPSIEPFKFTIPSSLTIDEITLHPVSNSPYILSFTPGTQNILTITPMPSLTYGIQDIQLLDEQKKPYKLLSYTV